MADKPWADVDDQVKTLTSADVKSVTYRYRGFGSIYDFPLYELDLPTEKFTQSVGWGSDRQVALVQTVTPAEIRRVQQNLGGDDIAERLTSLDHAGRQSHDSYHLVCDGGTTTLTVIFKNGPKYKVTVYVGGPALTEDQDQALHALHELIGRYGLDSTELQNRFPL